MTNQDFGPDSTTAGRREKKAQGMKDAASEAFAKASDAARDAGSKAKQAASETAATVTEQFKDMLDRQLGSGVSAAGQFASSIKIAAEELDRESPILAGMVRTFANKVEDYADDMQDQTVDHLARTASDFTRRQPALVFGLAALAGFFVFRTMKSAPELRAPPIQPDVPEDRT